MGIEFSFATRLEKFLDAIAQLPKPIGAARGVYREIGRIAVKPVVPRWRGRWHPHRGLWQQRHPSPARRGYRSRRRKAVLRAHRQWPQHRG